MAAFALQVMDCAACAFYENDRPMVQSHDRLQQDAKAGGHDAPEVALIVAAGRGARMGDAADGPKQYRDLGGKSVLAWAISALAERSTIKEVLVVIHPDDRALYTHAIGRVERRVPLVEPVLGGATRQASVKNGLEALSAKWPPETVVFIHDAARPFLSRAVIDAAVLGLAADGVAGVTPGRPVTDTLVMRDAAGEVGRTVPREGLSTVETPQVFKLGTILGAHRAAAAKGFAGTDDASLVQAAGGRVMVTVGSVGNVKITTSDDLSRARSRIAAVAPSVMRTGLGFDVHVFGPGDHVWLGGVRIPHTHGVVAHSDGDVILHALTDALLGTIADHDIGYHFRNTDPRWRGAPSHKFLSDAVTRVTAKGGRIELLDVTVLAEAPKVGPYRAAMTAEVARVVGIRLDQVSIKATTTEGLGAFGRREGLAAMATASVSFSAPIAARSDAL